MFCTLSPTCVTRSGEIQSVVDNSHVVTRGSSWLVSSTAHRAGLPGPEDHPCSWSHHSTARTAASTLCQQLLARPGSPTARISVSCHRLEAYCWAILPCSTKCMPQNIQQATHQLFVFQGSSYARYERLPLESASDLSDISCAVNALGSRKKTLGPCLYRCSILPDSGHRSVPRTHNFPQAALGKERSDSDSHTDSSNSYLKVISKNHFFGILCYIKPNLKTIIQAIFLVTFPNRVKITYLIFLFRF